MREFYKDKYRLKGKAYTYVVCAIIIFVIVLFLIYFFENLLIILDDCKYHKLYKLLK